MSKHTPGPWVAAGGSIEDEAKETTIATISEYKTLTPRQAANARLIASAPELLEALKQVMRWMPSFPAAADGIVGAHNAYDTAIQSARAAIAKAEGTE